MMKTIHVHGNELQVGDILHVWWNQKEMKNPHRDTILKLTPYYGLIKHVFEPHGAQIAEFEYNKVGMTIENGNRYTVDRDERENKVFRFYQKEEAESITEDARKSLQQLLTNINSVVK